MKLAIGGLLAECTKLEAPTVSLRMLTILEKIDGRRFEPSNIIIVDKYDGVYYQIVDGIETKEVIPV